MIKYIMKLVSVRITWSFKLVPAVVLKSAGANWTRSQRRLHSWLRRRSTTWTRRRQWTQSISYRSSSNACRGNWTWYQRTFTCSKTSTRRTHNVRIRITHLSILIILLMIIWFETCLMLIEYSDWIIRKHSDLDGSSKNDPCNCSLRLAGLLYHKFLRQKF